MYKLKVELPEDLGCTVMVTLTTRTGFLLCSDLSAKAGQLVSWEMGIGWDLNNCNLNIRGACIEPFTMRVGKKFFWDREIYIRPYLREVVEDG